MYLWLIICIIRQTNIFFSKKINESISLVIVFYFEAWVLAIWDFGEFLKNCTI